VNRLNLRRATALTAGALIGLASVAIVASPAMAHHPEPSGSYCATPDGKVTVNWSVISSETDIDGTITKLESTVPGDITGELAVGATLKKQGDGPLTGTQTYTFEGDIPELKLTVAARWERGKKRDKKVLTGERTVVAQPSQDCGPTESPEPTPPASPEPTETPAPSETPQPTDSPEPTPSASPTATPSTPAEEPEEPVFQLEETCDTMTFIVENPAKGIPFTATLTTEKGVTKKLESVPGKTTSVSFDAYKGLKVTVKYDVVDETETIEYTQPEECGQGGGLPVTGPAAGAIAGGAAVLLAAGAVLFVMARRRRIRFTV